jgi:hypothetical protein
MDNGTRQNLPGSTKCSHNKVYGPEKRYPVASSKQRGLVLGKLL